MGQHTSTFDAHIFKLVKFSAMCVLPYLAADFVDVTRSRWRSANRDSYRRRRSRRPGFGSLHGDGFEPADARGLRAAV